MHQDDSSRGSKISQDFIPSKVGSLQSFKRKNHSSSFEKTDFGCWMYMWSKRPRKTCEKGDQNWGGGCGERSGWNSSLIKWRQYYINCMCSNLILESPLYVQCPAGPGTEKGSANVY